MRADTMTLIDITKQYVNRYSVVYFMSAFPIKIPPVFKFRYRKQFGKKTKLLQYLCIGAFFYYG